MTRPQRRFALALVLFAAWVGVLAYMAGTSGERPQARASAATPE